MTLEGKTAVITGASRGIGAALARMLHAARRQPRSCLAQRRRPRARPHGRARRATCATSTRSSSSAATPRPRFGGIDIVVANAGVGAYGAFLDLSREHLDEMIDVNLKGTLYAIRAALPHMAGREGDVITLASEAGRRGLPHEAVYCASKFGQVGFTRALDHELREQGIRCTNVCPGGVATDFALEPGRGRTPDVAAGDDDCRGRRRGVRLRARAPTSLPDARDGAAPDDRDVLGLRRRCPA